MNHGMVSVALRSREKSQKKQLLREDTSTRKTRWTVCLLSAFRPPRQSAWTAPSPANVLSLPQEPLTKTEYGIKYILS